MRFMDCLPGFDVTPTPLTRVEAPMQVAWVPAV